MMNINVMNNNTILDGNVNEKMQKEFLFLEKVIKEKCTDGPVYYLANPGNFGDALIREGALKFFQHIGLEFIELKTKNTLRPQWWRTIFPPKGTLIFGGGGAWCNLWNNEYILKKIYQRFKNIIVLPSTYEIKPSIPNATFFCRDVYESKKKVPEAFFCHDMAFFIGDRSASEGVGDGYFFRTDAESSNKINIPIENNDISTKGHQYSNIDLFFDEIAKFAIIHTDRIHVAIAACLLGREVHLYPGAYFKHRALYLSSLKGYFNNVYFHDDKLKINIEGKNKINE